MFEEDPFSKNAQSIASSRHEALLLLKFSQTKQQVESKTIILVKVSY